MSHIAPQSVQRSAHASTSSAVVRIGQIMSGRPCSDSNQPVSREVSDATVIMAAVERGEPNAADRLLVLVYEELRKLATSKMARETPGQTLQPTELVHEAWLRLVGSKSPKFANRAHFFSAAAEAMRRILIDRARRKLTQRHGGGFERVDLEGQDLAAPGADQQLLAVHEVLDNLAKEHPVEAEVVKLRYFVGMTNEETAKVLGISVTTTKVYWTFARTWILHEIEHS
jgi:RNA polymerase sigma factor (TIGR02999 family)